MNALFHSSCDVSAIRAALLLLPRQNRILWKTFRIMNNNLQKKRNRNPDKWVLLQEWDAAQFTPETIEREKLAIFTEINIAACPDKFPVHKDRTAGLHFLTYDTSWTTSKGLVTKDLYDCPLKKRCKCKCQFLVCSSIVQTQLFVKSKHNAAAHANDTSKGLTYQLRKTIEQAVRTAPLQSAKSLARNLSNLSPSKQVQLNKYKAVGRVVSSVRAESTTMELCGIRVDSSHGSLHELCTSLSFANKIRSHNDDSSQYHLNLFYPVCLHHDIRAEHNIVIMVFSTLWMLLNHARVFNSGVPVQLVYDATGSITDVAVQLIGFCFTSFHAHMNLACLGFIPTDTESEESYTTVWTAYRKSLHALLHKVKLCCIHGCQFCSEIESVLSHPPMASHKDSEDFKKHVVAVHASLGDQHGGGKNFLKIHSTCVPVFVAHTGLSLTRRKERSAPISRVRKIMRNGTI